ncbi:MAG: DNA methyltransferase [Bacillota bacterium]
MENFLVLKRDAYLEFLDQTLELDRLAQVREHLSVLDRALAAPPGELPGLFEVDSGTEVVRLRADVLRAEIAQLRAVYTLSRARHYLKQLRAGAAERRTTGFNDINLNRWKEYDEVLTDSLWVVDRRDTSGAHLGWYWGNFIPQIPHQLLLRYTRRGDWVLDPFAGSGTTLIECRRLGRHGLGVELNREVATRAEDLVAREENPYEVTTVIFAGDSTSFDFGAVTAGLGTDRVQLVLLHPPYHNIIRFDDDPRNLCNAPSVEQFLELLGRVVDNAGRLLEKGRYLAVVIGDRYSKGEWIPLGFYSMEQIRARGYVLKSIIVKNFEETRGKRQQKELWRYRALAGGFYVFKHEYILLFQKP